MRTSTPAVERVLRRVETTDGGCWEFTLGRTTDGYGLITNSEGTRLAHRVVYEALVGPVPDGLQLDHLCRVRHCVNPAHLEPVTNHENARRGMRVAKTHCPQGHPYDAENTYVLPSRPFARYCRECGRIRQRARDARRRGEG